MFKTSEFEKIKFILMDVEGTTSDIHFVKNVLFPYSAREMKNFVEKNSTNPVVRDCLLTAQAENKNVGVTKSKSDDSTSSTINTSLLSSPNLNVATATEQMLKWIHDDVKHPALKTLQGLIWQEGYESGAFKSHIYDEVISCWQKWQASGLRLGIYSSGSVMAQKLLFAHTTGGNLLHYLDAHFDLDVGHKREATSYRKIAEQLRLPPEEILFLSDIPEELDAAHSADYKVAHIVRPGTATCDRYKPYTSFTEL